MGSPSRKTIGLGGGLGSSPAVPITVKVWPCSSSKVSDADKSKNFELRTSFGPIFFHEESSYKQ